MSRSSASRGTCPATTLGPMLLWAALAVASSMGAAGDVTPRRGAGWKPPEVPPLNLRVVEHARKQLGRSVGGGECTELATLVLDRAGARRFPWVATGDYVWGREIASFREALPGDIVQFRDAVFEGRRPLSGGRWQTWHYEYPHHTAVIAEVRQRGSEVVLLHQNVSSARSKPEARRLVQQGLIRPDSLQPGGRIRIYRPVARDEADATTEPPERPETRSTRTQTP